MIRHHNRFDFLLAAIMGLVACDPDSFDFVWRCLGNHTEILD